MKLEPAFLASPQTQKLVTIFGQFRLYFVGGCVRNTVLDQPVTDLDLCTDATPDQMMALALPPGVKRVPTGVDHGTVTFVLDGSSFEVTTFREDVETDGRHAKVRYATEIAIDAARRDFTMNAMYLAPDGTLLDPVGGFQDALNGHVRFIGDPKRRIEEDYLRILRFFRFTATYGTPELGVDADGLAACAAGLSGLEGLAAERVTAELEKLLGAKDPAMAVAAMASSGVLAQVVPGADHRALAPLVHLEGTIDPDPMRRLAVLGGVTSKLRLSRKTARHLEVIRAGIAQLSPAHALAYSHGAEVARSILLARAALFEEPLSARLETEIALGAHATFPIRAADLAGEMEGKELGDALRRAEAAWIESSFSLDRDALLRVARA